jgi:hypothetical protein
MQKLKEVARRSTAFAAAVGLLVGIGASALPMAASADSLNPLTERSLTLSSSSPGWSAVDGSGNPTYAPPNSGANGFKTGETFTFRVSSDATVKAFTFQYCTTAAGKCQAPGDDASASVPGTDDATHSDLNVVLGDGTNTTAPSEISSANYATIQARTTTDIANGPFAGLPKADGSEGTFVILTPSSANSGVAGNTADTVSAGWTMSTSNVEDGSTTTGKNNFITIKNSGGQALKPGDQVKVIFYGTDDNYITNPGSGSFFVKINDYNDDTYQNFRDGYPDSSHTGNDLIDGGVTVANIMNESIQIQTKVLETMDFSVGIIDPDTLTPTELGAAHGQCDPILTRLPSDTSAIANSLFIGNHDAEDSLETGTAYDTHSYWRLSSNSSGGATVYYSGETLSNTEGDQIKAIGTTAAISHPGTEQFGLAIDNVPAGTDSTEPVDHTVSSLDSSPDYLSTTMQGALDNVTTTPAGNDFVSLVAAHASDSPSYWHNPQLYPLAPETVASNGTDYGLGMGTINPDNTDPQNPIAPTAKFAFDPEANTVPVPIASEDTQVVNCVTAKMRYLANIAATTPAGIYATKINYLAAPQY